MDLLYELKYHDLEEKYWWFEARRDVLFRLIKSADKKSKILEVGCSGGPLLAFLKQRGFNNTYGIDISSKAIDICKEREIERCFVMNGAKTSFTDEDFNIVIASDILEHIKDDQAALIEWNRILSPSGKLIVFVPAFGFLWSEHDEINHHYRRYSKLELVRLLKAANFEIEMVSYWNFCLFFPASLVRVFQRAFFANKRQKHDQLYKFNPIINRLLIYLLEFENCLLTKLNFPIGVSVFAVARKRN